MTPKLQHILLPLSRFAYGLTSNTETTHTHSKLGLITQFLVKERCQIEFTKLTEQEHVVITGETRPRTYTSQMAQDIQGMKFNLCQLVE